MKKLNNVVWGVILVAAGVIIALNALGIANFNIFFSGWWTLFLIVPGAVGLVTKREKLWSLIITVVGVFLLLSAQNVIPSDLLGKLLLPAVIIIIGAKMIFSGMLGSKNERRKMRMRSVKSNVKSYNAIFSGDDISPSGEIFEGAELNAVFGGLSLDLREAIIESDCIIRITAIFGGVDVILPEGVRTDVRSTSIFGGLDDKTPKDADSSLPTVYIDATCMFGGADVK